MMMTAMEIYRGRAMTRDWFKPIGLMITAAFLFALMAAESRAQSASEQGHGLDCGVIRFDQPDRNSDTTLSALDALFFDSVSRFSFCDADATASSDAQDSNKDASEAGEEGEEGEEGESVESIAATGGLKGTDRPLQSDSEQETERSQGQSGDNDESDFDGFGPEASNDPDASDDLARENSDGSDPGDEQGGNGAIPADIPPGDDDDILQAQIRAAAMAETDPELKEELWAEYRKYKGLPPK